MTATLTPQETAKADIRARVREWTEQLVEALKADYQRKYPNAHFDKEYEIETGRKYHKIMQYDTQGGERGYGGAVHAFIDKQTGEVYKPASWRGPAKIVRYDLRVINDRVRCLANADWAGGYLYVR